MPVAFKVFKDSCMNLYQMAVNELDLMSRINHPNVLKCYGLKYHNNSFILVLEKGYSSLYDLMIIEKMKNIKYIH